MGGPGSGGNRRKDHPRPVTFDQIVADVYLQRMRDGESNLRISAELDMPSTDTIWHWTHGRHEAPAKFKDEYINARLAQADNFAGQIIEIADGMDDSVQSAMQRALDKLPPDASDVDRRKAAFYARRRSTDAAKEQISARKWTAGRMHPNHWGDRMAVEHSTDPDNPPRFDFSNLNTEQLERLVKLEEELGDGTT